jgi:cytochrome c-type biogenesis protein CcmH/NrfF
MRADLVLWGINDVALAITAILVWWYARATAKLVKTSQDQVQTAQAQLKELKR